MAARLERRVLRRLFENEIYPHRRIVADFLTHGVTRARLQAQIQENGGYHIYHAHVQARPADAIYRAAEAEFTGAERLERLTRNLVRALRDEPILLVLDNFETNLKPQAEPGTAAEPLWACQDPAWDRCLTQLAAALVGTPSRVLITCRRPLAALAGTACQRVRRRCTCGSMPA